MESHILLPLLVLRDFLYWRERSQGSDHMEEFKTAREPQSLHDGGAVEKPRVNSDGIRRQLVQVEDLLHELVGGEGHSLGGHTADVVE